MVTADVTGEMGSDKMGHDSSAFDASSAMSQAIRLGIALSGTIDTGAGAGEGGGISRGGGWVDQRISSVRLATSAGFARLYSTVLKGCGRDPFFSRTTIRVSPDCK